MLMIKTWIIVVTIFSFVFISCGPEEKFKGPLTDIKNHQEKLDSVEKVLENIAFDSLELILQEIHQNEKDVKKYFKDDTLDMEFGRAMTDFKGIRKSIKSPELKKKSFQNEIDALQKQFKDLKHDIEKGVLSEEEVKKFTSKEVGDTKMFMDQFSLFHSAAQKSFKVYYTYKDVINKTIQKLKNKHESTPS